MSIYKLTNHSNPKIDKILKTIVRLHPDEINLSLHRIKNLLKKLDNPQNKLPFAIHIAGTNGKGSIVTALYKLQKLNRKIVHVYRSPHLVSINERIIVANKIISDESLLQALTYVYKVNNLNTITFFEFLTATAFYIFSKLKADLLICEVGLGGTYDATNTLNHKKKACIISSIGLDHKEYLGNSIKKIANEKSGILKKNNLLICSHQNKSALNVVKKASLMNKCKTFFYGKDWHIKNKNLYFKNGNKINLSNLSLEGNHQYKNIGCVIMACNNLRKLRIGHEKIPDYISKLKVEGRLHKLNGHLRSRYPNTDFWVDCAHNALGFQVLRKWVLKKQTSRIIIILSLGIRKDYKAILKQIKKINPKFLVLIRKTNFSSRSAKDLYVEASRLKIKCKIINSTLETIEFAASIKSRYNARNICLIAGSINLVGEIINQDKLI
ncbi:MAG: Folylpolyglutamate synthase [Alphaproteobacteria bacterium MarineAlpha9_Bin4]|nr:MAG: Folylpolyglutamate synthase [Alphaproteobacteria bacterium MarineAlpha9_Bin4]